jgi:uncharacterized protein (DUF2267 family)
MDMDYDEFIARVTRRAHLEPDEAEEAVRAALQTRELVEKSPRPVFVARADGRPS